MCVENILVCIFEFLNKPIIIAFVSSFILALFGKCFQHRNWKVQHELATQKAIKEKNFDKEANIAKDIFYLTAMRTQLSWNIFNARREGEEIYKYWNKSQEVIAKYIAALQEIRIYFGEDGGGIKKKCERILKIYHDIDYETKRKIFKKSDVCEEWEKHMNSKDKIVEDIIDKIANEIYGLINKNRIIEYRSKKM